MDKGCNHRLPWQKEMGYHLDEPSLQQLNQPPIFFTVWTKSQWAHIVFNKVKDVCLTVKMASCDSPQLTSLVCEVSHNKF